MENKTKYTTSVMKNNYKISKKEVSNKYIPKQRDKQPDIYVNKYVESDFNKRSERFLC